MEGRAGETIMRLVCLLFCFAFPPYECSDVDTVLSHLICFDTWNLLLFEDYILLDLETLQDIFIHQLKPGPRALMNVFNTGQPDHGSVKSFVFLAMLLSLYSFLNYHYLSVCLSIYLRD